MPFGLTNTPAAFQCFVNSIFADMLDMCIVVYLDNILIYSSDPAAHRKQVQEVLWHLRANRLYLKPEKCEWHLETIKYFGYILSPSGLSMARDKIQMILDWPEPWKVKDIQAFLGFANFYRRFIQGYSNIVVPLMCLTHKGVPWSFSDDCQKSFLCLKEVFTSALVLVHWIPDALITIKTDASNYAVTAILSITCSNNEIHPITFHSCTLSRAELNYDTHDKELLAIFEVFSNWRHYLEGSAQPIDIVMDHKNLEYFSTTKLLTRRQARWSEFLCQFNLAVRYHPGKLGAKPNALTRRWDVYPKEGDKDYACVNPDNYRPIFTNEQLTASLCATYLEAPMLQASVLVDIEQLQSDILSPLPNNPVTSPLLSAKSLDDPRWTIDPEGFLLRDNRIYIPKANDLQLCILWTFHDHPTAGHFGQN